MPVLAVIGEGVRVQGFALSGALVFPADSAAAARAAWRALPAEVAVVVLTPLAARWLRDALGEEGMAPPAPAGGAGAPVGAGEGLPRRPGVLPVVMPP